MASLSANDTRRALMRAAEWHERCRLFGYGDVRRGAFRLAVVERRAAFAVDYAISPRNSGPMEKVTGAAGQSNTDAEEASPAADGPKRRTVRRRAARQRARERQVTAAAEAAAAPAQCAGNAPVSAADADGDHVDADATMAGTDSHEQPQRDASGSDGDGGGAAQAALQPSSACVSLQACTAAVDGTGTGVDAEVQGAQMQMAQLLPPSVAEPSTTSAPRIQVGFSPGSAYWTTVIGRGKGSRSKRPASRPASALASPVSSAQVGPA
jgi:hypothetical protein